MKSAYLKQEDGSWKRTTKTNTILDHQGEAIYADTQEDQNDILATISAHEGRHAVMARGRIVLSDVPVYDNFKKVIGLVRGGERVRINYLSSYDWFRSAGGVMCHVGDSWQIKAIEGFVATSADKNDGWSDVWYDLELWTKLRRRWKSAKKKEELKKSVNKDAMWGLVNVLCKSMGTRSPNSFVCAHMMLFVAAHDGMMGRRATNKVLVPFARKWARTNEEQVKKYRQWMGDHVDILDARLRCVVKFPKAVKKAQDTN